jgi:two-component system OmpR family sensor kinase
MSGRRQLRKRRRRQPRTLRTRLVVASVALIAVVCAVIGTVTTIALRSHLYEQLDDSVKGAAMRAAGPGPEELAGKKAVRRGRQS